MTPEGKVKKNLKDFLKEYAKNVHFIGDVYARWSKRQWRLYSHWPVLNGMGAPELDCNITWYSRAISIECKAPGKDFSARQTLTTEDKMSAGGIVLGYRGAQDNTAVQEVLNYVADGDYNSARIYAEKQLLSEGFVDA